MAQIGEDTCQFNGCDNTPIYGDGYETENSKGQTISIEEGVTVCDKHMEVITRLFGGSHPAREVESDDSPDIDVVEGEFTLAMAIIDGLVGDELSEEEMGEVASDFAESLIKKYDVEVE